MGTSNQKYYRISPEVDTPETGRAYPALMTVDDYDFNGPRSVHKLKHNEFPDFEPDLRFKLANGAKLCDVMSEAAISGTGLIVSEKFIKSISNFNIPFCKTFPFKVNSNLFYWVHLLSEPNDEIINYNSSLFVLKKFSKIITQVNPISFIDIQKIRSDYSKSHLVKPTKLVFNSHDLDMFTIPFSSEIFASDKLKNKLIENKLTGISFDNV